MIRYHEIAIALRKDIQEQYISGDFLPTEKALSERFKVNRHTVRRAIDELVKVGLIKRHQGKGNQVLSSAIDYSLNSQSCFSYNLSNRGLELQTQVLSCSQILVDGLLATSLNLTEATPAIRLITKRSMEGRPVCLIEHHVFGSDLTTMKRYQQGSLHKYLNETHDFSADRTRIKLRARMPLLDEAEQLNIETDVPVMLIQSLYQLKNTQTLMEYSVSITRSDIFEYIVES